MDKASRIKRSFRHQRMKTDGEKRTNFQETYEDDYLQNGLRNILRAQLQAEHRDDAQELIERGAVMRERFGPHRDQVDEIIRNPSHTRVVSISIDSRYRDRTYRIRDRGIWFNIAQGEKSTTNGVIGLQFPLVHVTSMEIMNDIIYPKKFQAGITYAPNNYFNEVNMLLQEMDSQSFRGPKNNFHFTFEIQSLDTIRYRLPIPYHSVFNFPLPVILDKSLTFRFFTPTDDAGLDDDVFYVTIQYTNPAQFTIVQPLENGLPIPHNFSSNDRVCFEDFASSTYLYNSGNPTSPVYSEKFYPVTVIDDETFTLPLDFTDPTIANDSARPGTIIYSDVRTLSLNIVLNDLYALYGDGDKFADAGQTFYFKNTYLTFDEPGVNFNAFAVAYLLRPQGIRILNVTPYSSGYQYIIDLKAGTYPVISGTPSPGNNLYFEASLSPGVITAPVKIFDGSRRIRFAMCFTCNV